MLTKPNNQNKLIRRVKYRKNFKHNQTEVNRKDNVAAGSNLQVEEMMEFGDEFIRADRPPESVVLAENSTKTSNQVETEDSSEETSEYQENVTSVEATAGTFNSDVKNATAELPNIFAIVTVNNDVKTPNGALKNTKYDLLIPIAEEALVPNKNTTTLTSNTLSTTAAHNDYDTASTGWNPTTGSFLNYAEVSLHTTTQKTEQINKSAATDTIGIVENSTDPTQTATPIPILPINSIPENIIAIENRKEVLQQENESPLLQNSMHNVNIQELVSKNNRNISDSSNNTSTSWLKDVALKALDGGNAFQQVFAINVGKLKIHLFNASDLMSFWKLFGQGSTKIPDNQDITSSTITGESNRKDSSTATTVGSVTRRTPVTAAVNSLGVPITLPKIKLPIDPRSLDVNF